MKVKTYSIIWLCEQYWSFSHEYWNHRLASAVSRARALRKHVCVCTTRGNFFHPENVSFLALFFNNLIITKQKPRAIVFPSKISLTLSHFLKQNLASYSEEEIIGNLSLSLTWWLKCTLTCVLYEDKEKFVGFADMVMNTSLQWTVLFSCVCWHVYQLVCTKFTCIWLYKHIYCLKHCPTKLILLLRYWPFKFILKLSIFLSF